MKPIQVRPRYSWPGLLISPSAGTAQDHKVKDLEAIPGPMEGLVMSRTPVHDVDDGHVNHDGLISLKEATDSSNRAVGGFFFQAYADGNGTVSQEEHGRSVTPTSTRSW